MKKKNATTVVTIAFLVILSLISSELTLQNVGAQTSPIVTSGTATVGESVYRFSSNKDASAFELTEYGTMTSISVYFTTSRFRAKTAIYTDVDGNPGALITQSVSEQIDSVGWHTFTIPQNLLSPGKYWFAIVCSSGKASGSATSGNQTSQHCAMRARYSKEFEETFGTPNIVDNRAVSMYGTFVPNTAAKQLEYGIYWDKKCSNATGSINWGVLESGTTKNLTVYVRNEGNVPFSLSKSLLNWNPSNATADIALTWNYMNQTLAPTDIANLTLTLAVKPDAQILGPFSFDSEISAIETSS